MKNPFKKEIASYASRAAETPYQHAQAEWDARIGSARVQARSWRLVAILSLLSSLVLIICLAVVLAVNENHIYVAEVTQAGRLVNVAPLQVQYQPNEAQKSYFLTNFVQMVRSVPLDPVLAKQNWLKSYKFLQGQSVGQLNTYFRENNPVDLLGKKTVILQIVDVNQLTPATTHIDWTEITTNTNGQEESKKNYSGVFTTIIKQPKTQEEILTNPLGIYIVDFNISPTEK